MCILNISVLDCSGKTGITYDDQVFTYYGISPLSLALAQIQTKENQILAFHKFSIEQVGEQIQDCLRTAKIEVVKVSFVQDLDFLLEVLSPFFQQFPHAKYVLDASHTGLRFEEAHVPLLQQFDLLLLPEAPENFLAFDYTAMLTESNICPVAYHQTQELASHLHLYKGARQFAYYGKKGVPAQVPFAQNVLAAALVGELAKGKKLQQACKNARRYLAAQEQNLRHQAISSK